MSKHKRKSIIFALRDTTFSSMVLECWTSLGCEITNQVEILYYHDEKSRIDILSNYTTVVFSLNANPADLFAKAKFNEVTYVSSTGNEQYLSHYTKINLVGFQRHLLESHLLNGVDANKKSNFSLGMISQQPSIVEPVLRSSQLVQVDMNVLKGGELYDDDNVNAFGMTTEQLVQVIKTAGYSETLKLININLDENKATRQHASFIAAACWYFAESRIQWMDTSKADIEGSYVVMHPEFGEFIQFYHIAGAQQCWFKGDDMAEKQPCSTDEYYQAINEGEFSNRISTILEVAMRG